MPKYKKNKNKQKTRKTLLPHTIVLYVHKEVFTEVQYRFPGLHNLSLKTGHKLLDEISEIIANRLKDLGNNTGSIESCFKFSQLYRSKHPHSTDFQLIQTTLHRLQDSHGAPRLQLNEEELMRPLDPATIDKVPLDKVKSVCSKFTTRISHAIADHLAALDTDVTSGDTEKDAARKKVREELKKMIPYMPAALQQVAAYHFIPQEQPHRKIRIYGEPFLPGREAMEPFTSRYNTIKSRYIRSSNMYNLLMFRVDPSQVATLRAMDATVIHGAKLTIRWDVPIRDANKVVREDLVTYFGGTKQEAKIVKDEDDDDDDDDDGGVQE